jgi:hypothetical protein
LIVLGKPFGFEIVVGLENASSEETLKDGITEADPKRTRRFPNNK